MIFSVDIKHEDTGLWAGPLMESESWETHEKRIMELNYCLECSGANVRFLVGGEYVDTVYMED